LRYFIPVISILIIAIVVVLMWRQPATPDPMPRLVSLPELQACSCDSALRCMTDQDYMQLIAWQQENEWIIETYCVGC